MKAFEYRESWEQRMFPNDGSSCVLMEIPE